MKIGLFGLQLLLVVLWYAIPTVPAWIIFLPLTLFVVLLLILGLAGAVVAWSKS